MPMPPLTAKNCHIAKPMPISLSWNSPPAELKQASLLQKFAFWSASALGTGLFPASGTFGALLAFLLHILFFPTLFTPEHWLLGAVVILLVVGFGIWTAEITERFTGKKDDSRITIDEVAGYYIAVFLLPAGLYYTIPAFILCRILDIIKPPPANALQSLHGGIGIMMDDVISSIYACLIIHAVIYFGWL